MFDWVSELKYYRFLRHYQNPDRRIRGPFPETLHTWDQLCQKTRVVAIGGVDAHARRYPLLPFVVFPYEDLFRTLRTHVLTDAPLVGSVSEDIPRLVQALRAGHCFIAYDRLCDASGTRFGSADGVLLMGDERPFDGPVDLEVRLPTDAELTVLRNGHPIASLQGKVCTFCANAPGVYRAEAKYGGKPWIYTNPIYLRPGA